MWLPTLRAMTNLLFFSLARYTLPNLPLPKGLPISKSLSDQSGADLEKLLVSCLPPGAIGPKALPVQGHQQHTLKTDANMQMINCTAHTLLYCLLE